MADDIRTTLDDIAHMGASVDARIEQLLDRQFRSVDQHLNGTVASFLHDIEVIRRLPFRETES